MVLDGKPPKRKVVRPEHWAAFPGRPESIPIEDLVVSEAGAVANVFVRIEDPGVRAVPAPPAEPAQLTAHGLRFVPHVMGVRVGQRLRLRNGDPLLHSFHGDGVKNPPFNRCVRDEGSHEVVLAEAEDAIPVKSDICPWMRAWIFVMPHPWFAVTDSDGRFELKGLPPGRYRVEARHEKLGTLTQEVALGDAGAVELRFVFTMK